VFKKFFVGFMAGLFLLTVGCSGSSGSVQPDSDTFQIVTSFYPVYIATINVTRDVPGVEVINMTQPQTGCLHDYQLKPDDLITLETADAFVVNGAGMEAFLQSVLDQQADLAIVEASKDIPLLTDDSGETNPHVWVSVSNSILQAKNIAEQLGKLDPEHAVAYQSNADIYIAKLETLRDKMHQAIDPIINKDIITFHEAFPYFAAEFGLNIVAVIEREPGTAPTAQELSQTIQIIKDSGIKALFAEPQYEAKAAETIAAETGATVYRLDPAVTGDAETADYDSYIKIMESNLAVLQEALK